MRVCVCVCVHAATVSSYPDPDAKIRSNNFTVQHGGNAGNVAICAARLTRNITTTNTTPLDDDAGTKRPSNETYATRVVIGSAIADDATGKEMKNAFRDEGVETCFKVDATPGVASPFTYIIVDEETGSRTCIHTAGPKLNCNDDDAKQLDKIAAAMRRAELCFFDGRHTEAAIAIAARIRAGSATTRSSESLGSRGGGGAAASAQEEHQRRDHFIVVEAERVRDNLNSLPSSTQFFSVFVTMINPSAMYLLSVRTNVAASHARALWTPHSILLQYIHMNCVMYYLPAPPPTPSDFSREARHQRRFVTPLRALRCCRLQSNSVETYTHRQRADKSR